MRNATLRMMTSLCFAPRASSRHASKVTLRSRLRFMRPTAPRSTSSARWPPPESAWNLHSRSADFMTPVHLRCRYRPRTSRWLLSLAEYSAHSWKRCLAMLRCMFFRMSASSPRNAWRSRMIRHHPAKPWWRTTRCACALRATSLGISLHAIQAPRMILWFQTLVIILMCALTTFCLLWYTCQALSALYTGRRRCLAARFSRATNEELKVERSVTSSLWGAKSSPKV
mmetsp:Transcript_68066/g.215318  ORF Transcript_68066/g.215318 Transcript_68066/m.215318 type:complete len:227 (+) Transcript_68066:648-1328(+)